MITKEYLEQELLRTRQQVDELATYIKTDKYKDDLSDFQKTVVKDYFGILTNLITVLEVQIKLI